MTFRVTVTADFESEAAANDAMSDMEEAVGKHNGDLQDSEIEDLDA